MTSFVDLPRPTHRASIRDNFLEKSLGEASTMGYSKKVRNEFERSVVGKRFVREQPGRFAGSGAKEPAPKKGQRLAIDAQLVARATFNIPL